MTLKTMKILATSVLSATIVAPGLLAQESGQAHKADQQREQQRPVFASISVLIGAPIHLQASAEAKAEARKEGEEADKPTAEVTEWLVDTRDGSLMRAVVSVGGFAGIGDKIVLVPSKDLSWNNAMERFQLGLTEEQLKAMPAFDLEAATEKDLDAACGIDRDAIRKGDVKPADASVEKATNKVGAMAPVAATARIARASELAEMAVYAGAEEFGSTQDLIVDRSQNRIVLAVVNNGSTVGLGGTDYLIAFPHFTVCKHEDGRILCARAATAQQLKQSEKFEQPENGPVDPVAAQRVLDAAKAKSKTEAGAYGSGKRR